MVTRRSTSARERWDRLGLAVRCGHAPTQPALIRRYLEAARRLEASGDLDALSVQRRSFGLLIQTALDPALPWTWRLACLDHTTLPRARLTSLLKHSGPAQLAALERDWEAAVAAVDEARLAPRPADDPAPEP
jgi:hypothetical protein